MFQLPIQNTGNIEMSNPKISNYRELFGYIHPDQDENKEWYCSVKEDLGFGRCIHRYLQFDGTWGNQAKYFSTKEEIEALLENNANEPDFTIEDSDHNLD